MSFKHGHGVSASQLPAALGPQLEAASLSITFASDAVGFPVQLQDGAGNDITSQVSGTQRALDVGVNVAGVQVDPRAIRALTSADVVSAAQSGVWNITDISGTVSLPTGAATAAKQDTGNTSLAGIDSKLAGTISVSAASLPLPTGAATEATVSAIDAKLAGTIAVSAAALPLPTGAATETTLAAIDSKLGGTLAISAVALPLPTGAATEATLAAQSAKLPAALGQAAMASSLTVAIASDQSAIPVSQSGTWNIADISGTVSLPTGAATSANQAAANTKLDAISALLTAPLPASTGRAYADSVRHDYTSVNVTSGAWVELIAATAADINSVYIFDSSGQTLELGVGAAAAEARKLLIFPGGLDAPLAIAAGSRVSVRAVSGTADAGEISLVGLS